MIQIGKHLRRNDFWPGSIATDTGDAVSIPHYCPPEELVSDRHYNVYVKYALAHAYLNAQDLEFWTNQYEQMQQIAGYLPQTDGFFRLIDNIRSEGYDSASPIPIDNNYDVLDGTHRLATCLALRIFPKVHKFDRYSRQFSRERFAQFDADVLDRVESVREALLGRCRQTPTPTVVATIWGVSLPLWDDILTFIGHSRIKRAFQRACTPEDFARIIALAYAGDGISDQSLLRKIWTLTKFESAVGIIVLNLSQEEVMDLKPRLRDYIVPQTTAYHYDSVIHTIDNDLFANKFLGALEPYKPVGSVIQHEGFSERLERFFNVTDSRNSFFRSRETNLAGNELSIEASARVQIQNRFKLVIFDLDGVLVDSEAISVSAYLRVLEEAGVSISFNDAYEIFAGISKADGERILMERFGITLTDEQRLAKQTWVRSQRSRMKPIPGIEALLKKISCITCIASGSSPQTIDRSLQTIGFESYFPSDRRFSASQVNRGKPAPDIFLYCAEKMGVNADECIVVEDSLPGIAAAKAAGMHFLWFSGAIHSEKYADQIVHYAGVRKHPDARALEESLRDYAFKLR